MLYLVLVLLGGVLVVVVVVVLVVVVVEDETVVEDTVVTVSEEEAELEETLEDVAGPACLCCLFLSSSDWKATLCTISAISLSCSSVRPVWKQVRLLLS